MSGKTQSLRMKKKRLFEEAGLVFKYGNWVSPRHEVAYCGMVLAMVKEGSDLLRDAGWSDSDIREVMPVREPVSDAGLAEWEQRNRRAG